MPMFIKLSHQSPLLLLIEGSVCLLFPKYMVHPSISSPAGPPAKPLTLMPTATCPPIQFPETSSVPTTPSDHFFNWRLLLLPPTQPACSVIPFSNLPSISRDQSSLVTSPVSFYWFSFSASQEQGLEEKEFVLTVFLFFLTEKKQQCLSGWGECLSHRIFPLFC